MADAEMAVAGDADADVDCVAAPPAHAPLPAVGGSAGLCGHCFVAAADAAPGPVVETSVPPVALHASFRMGLPQLQLPATGLYMLQHGALIECLPVWQHAAGFWLYSAKGRWAVNKTSPDTPHVPVRGLLPLFESDPHNGKFPSAASVSGWRHIGGGTPSVTITAAPATPAEISGEVEIPSDTDCSTDYADSEAIAPVTAASAPEPAPPTVHPVAHCAVETAGVPPATTETAPAVRPQRKWGMARSSCAARQRAGSIGDDDSVAPVGMSAANIRALPCCKQKDALGEELFRRVSTSQPSALAAKITGMLLEVGVEEALPLLSSEQLLGSKVQEALAVLKVYEKAFEVEEVRRSGQQVIEQAEADAARLRRDIVRAERSLQDMTQRHTSLQMELARRCDFPVRVDTLSWQELCLLDQRVADYHQTVRQQRQDRRLCKVCMDAESCVVLLPCKHQVLCAGCGARVDRCPICTQPILDRFEPFTD